MSLRSFPLPMIDADVRYYPNFLAENDADALMQRLMSDLRWRQDDIKMFGRTVRIPRLQAWYGDANVDYRYSGKTLTPLPWQSDLLQLKYRCEAVTGNSFNSVLANWYRDGQDSMGWHADNEPELLQGAAIASISLGAARDFDFKHVNDTKHQPQRQRVVLEHGSLLVMAGNTQQFWQHALPKRQRCDTSRLNFTFRCIIPDYHSRK